MSAAEGTYTEKGLQSIETATPFPFATTASCRTSHTAR